MKLFKGNIVKNFTATIFVFALLLPTAVQIAHAFESHEHKTCTELSTHIHEKQLDCSICDFHFSNFNFTLHKYSEFAVLHGYDNAQTVYLLPEFTPNYTHYFLRGPPFFS